MSKHQQDSDEILPGSISGRLWKLEKSFVRLEEQLNNINDRTGQTLLDRNTILNTIEWLRKDIDDLKEFKARIVLFASLGASVAGVAVDIIIRMIWK